MHSKLLRWLSLISLFAVVAFEAAGQAPAAAPAPAAPPAAPGTSLIGRIKATRVVGKVTIEDKATKVVTDLANDQEFAQGHIVHTGEAASVVLIFSNGATINLAHTSDLDVEQFTQDPFSASYKPSESTDEPSISQTSIKLTRGELVGNVKKLNRAGQPGGSNFKVGTPVGAAGIRGTTFRIVYRPTGNGQAFNFVLTTVEGTVEVVLATGTVTASVPVNVTQNTEVVINNVTVDTATNTLSVQTTAGTVAPVNAPPVAQAAEVTNVQVVQAAAQQIVQAVANTVFTAPPTPTPTPTPTNTGTQGSGNTSGQTTENNPNSNTSNQSGGTTTNPPSTTTNPPANNPPPTNNPPANPPSGSPGGTSNSPRVTPGAGG